MMKRYLIEVVDPNETYFFVNAKDEEEALDKAFDILIEDGPIQYFFDIGGEYDIETGEPL